MADTELLPCPFCGGSDAFVERLDYTAAYVQCDADVGDGCTCLARGPIAVQDDDGEDIPGGAGAIAAWNRRATPPSPSTAPEVDERAAFEAWAVPREFDLRRPRKTYHNTCTDYAWMGWQARAALASRPAEVDDEGLPVLPESKFCAWIQNGKVWNAFPHGVGNKSIWDSNGYWSERGFDREPLFTAEQYRQGQRDAVAADRGQRGGQQ